MPGPPGSRLPSSAKSLRQATVAELDEDLYGLWLPRQLLFNTVRLCSLAQVQRHSLTLDSIVSRTHALSVTSTITCRGE